VSFNFFSTPGSLGGLGFWFRGLGLGVFSKSIPKKQNLFPAPF
jgi:hypothetical protein